MCEYEAVDAEERPIPTPGSFSCAVLFCNTLELKGHVKKLAEARGAWSVERLQCGGDGEEALEAILTDGFPRAVFFNDIMHATSCLSTARVCALLARLRSVPRRSAWRSGATKQNCTRKRAGRVKRVVWRLGFRVKKEA